MSVCMIPSDVSQGEAVEWIVFGLEQLLNWSDEVFEHLSRRVKNFSEQADRVHLDLRRVAKKIERVREVSKGVFKIVFSFSLAKFIKISEYTLFIIFFEKIGIKLKLKTLDFFDSLISNPYLCRIIFQMNTAVVISAPSKFILTENECQRSVLRKELCTNVSVLRKINSKRRFYLNESKDIASVLDEKQTYYRFTEGGMKPKQQCIIIFKSHR